MLRQNILPEEMKVEYIYKIASAEFHRANKITVSIFIDTGEVNLAITSCVKCTK